MQLLDCFLHRNINHRAWIWSVLAENSPLITQMSVPQMISLRETGGGGLARLLGYALMTILHHLLPGQCSSLVNWISYWMEPHASCDSGVIRIIRRWWTPDKRSEWFSLFITANSLTRRQSRENWSGRLLMWQWQSLTPERRSCVNTSTLRWRIHYLIVLQVAESLAWRQCEGRMFTF